MKNYGTWDAFLIEQLAEQGDMSGYLSAVMEEYQIHGNVTTIQIALQSVIEALGGISELAKKTDIEPQVISEVLTSTEAPRIDTLRTILAALGCSLSITALETVDTHIEIAADAPIGTAIQPQA
jgi:DNA-binding phage protein